MSHVSVHLASSSPRRRELLQQIGVPFQVVAAAVDESVRPREAPEDYVLRLAAAKAAAATAPGRQVVLAADTAVVFDHQIFGKPHNREHALSMLADLSGQTHVVLTAVVVATVANTQQRLSRSEVTFRAIGSAEAQRYWDTGEPADKAGGYAIQGLGAVFVAQLRGSYSGVMGLPLFETAALLSAAGVLSWR